MTTTGERSHLLEAAVAAVVDAAVVEAQQQAKRLATGNLAVPPALAGRTDLLNLYLQARAGVDVTREVILLRRDGASWAEVGAGTGMTRQSAHERWAPAVRAVLNRDGSGHLAELARPDTD